MNATVDMLCADSHGAPTVLLSALEPQAVRPEYRDGLLAICGLVVLVGFAVLTETADQLFAPAGALGGVAVAVALEAVFLRYPSRALGVWEQRGVPLAGLCIVLVAGAVGVQLAPWLIAVPVWGVFTYLALLGCVLVGVGNPVSVLSRAEE
ncbi:hypothetical protein GRX03_05980 [Halovenus sp. WSH3]|uniref:Uncharacterized protein n=1 Tax=Halovenus carboxidivorans TaxID=2692199 RepID=A0A6B0T020_9EURY|nr:hypothetical protein [Halovenus carboxidivorans]MXR51155.1 hypothetical protein [Halovenus carboxidivorans]